MASVSSGDEDFFDAEIGSRVGHAAADEMPDASTKTGQSEQPKNGTEHATDYVQLNTAGLSKKKTKGLEGQTSRSEKRYSLPHHSPPAIPDHFLALGKRATVAQRRQADKLSHKQLPKPLDVISSPIARHQRPSTSGGERQTRRDHDIIPLTAPLSKAAETRRKSLSSIPAQSHKETLARLESRSERRKSADMSRLGSRRDGDLFLELANDQDGIDDRLGTRNRTERVSSRMSFSGKRRSLPAEGGLPAIDRRPKSSGHAIANRPSAQPGDGTSHLQRHVDRYHTPSRAGLQAEDAISISSRSISGRHTRYTTTAEYPSSKPGDLLPQYGRRRPSVNNNLRPSALANQLQDSNSESPAESSEPKQSLPDSSVDSQPEDAVWDELDELKSRIKKLELTGKSIPPSGATVSTDLDRPRTATTAPTTIDSSPKHETTRETEKRPDGNPEMNTINSAAEYAVGGPNTANIHPLLHSALATAKPLLNASLYRTLEATAADALQLAALTGSAGPQGTAFSAAAIINGVTASDRHVRRKADNMCRNLTDLCLALCDGKNEAPSSMSSPVMVDSSAKNSPTIRYPGSSPGMNGGAISRMGSRPMSRLEARRTSILGSQAGSSLGNSPLGSGEDLSASEQESSPSYLKVQDRRPVDRAPSRLQAARLRRHEEDDEDPTIRPHSRAVTDAGRNRSGGSREYHTPQSQRSTSLRDSLAVRRAYAAVHDSSRDSAGRRRFHDTTPVLEEDVNSDDYQPISQSKRRVTSLGQYSPRSHNNLELPNRATSVSQRRQHVLVE